MRGRLCVGKIRSRQSVVRKRRILSVVRRTSAVRMGRRRLLCGMNEKETVRGEPLPSCLQALLLTWGPLSVKDSARPVSPASR